MKYGSKMDKNINTNYYGDLVVTTTFSVDHPNYIGKHLRFRRVGNNILILIIIGAAGTAFYRPEWLIIGIPIALGAAIWTFFNERTIREINTDLDSEPIEVEGVVKKERESLKPGHYPYPRGFVDLENHKDIFRADITFIRRVHVGQKVRFICTPKLKFVKAWQLVG